MTRLRTPWSRSRQTLGQSRTSRGKCKGCSQRKCKGRYLDGSRCRPRATPSSTGDGSGCPRRTPQRWCGRAGSGGCPAGCGRRRAGSAAHRRRGSWAGSSCCGGGRAARPRLSGARDRSLCAASAPRHAGCRATAGAREPSAPAN
eukprot:651959-Rhodomonas_salina.2